jgi:hypothetical protein
MVFDITGQKLSQGKVTTATIAHPSRRTGGQNPTFATDVRSENHADRFSRFVPINIIFMLLYINTHEKDVYITVYMFWYGKWHLVKQRAG